MRTDTLAVRDRLLAVLRESGDYLSSTEVGAAAGLAFHHGACRPVRHDKPNFAFCVGGKTDYWQIPLNINSRAHGELAALEKQGLVVRAVQESPYRVYWHYVAEEFDPGPMLEAMWEAPAAVDRA